MVTVFVNRIFSKKYKILKILKIQYFYIRYLIGIFLLDTFSCKEFVKKIFFAKIFGNFY